MNLKSIVIFILVFVSANFAFSQYFVVKFSADKLKGCDSLTVQFEDKTSGMVKWLWDFGDNHTDSVEKPVHTYSQAGNYTVKLTATKSNGTTGNLEKIDFVKVYKSPVANFTFSDSSFSTSFSLQMKSTTHFDSTGFTYKWNFGDNDSAFYSSVIHTYKNEGSFPVTLKVLENISGCINDTSKIVTVTGKFIIPTFFTPNGDGIYDEFMIKTTGASTYSFDVMDRWGNQLYSITSKSIRWDGRSSAGTPLPTGIYFYVLTSKDDGVHAKKTGFFQLYR